MCVCTHAFVYVSTCICAAHAGPEEAAVLDWYIRPRGRSKILVGAGLHHHVASGVDLGVFLPGKRPSQTDTEATSV